MKMFSLAARCLAALILCLAIPLAAAADERVFYCFSESVMLPEQRMMRVDWTAGGHYLFEDARDQLYAVLDGLSIEENAAPAPEALITGPVLVGTLPREAVIVTDTADGQGSYLQELLVFDGAVSLVTLRQKIDEGHPVEMPTEDFLSDYFHDMRDVESLETGPVAGYPAERIRFVTGAEEDTAVVDAVLIRADEYYFAFWADTQIDIYYGYHDAFAEGEVPELVDMWIGSLDLFDAG